MKHRKPGNPGGGCEPERRKWISRDSRRAVVVAGGAIAALVATTAAMAHGIAGGDEAFINRNVGTALGPYMYLGAKHMVTGYDHLLFLAGVIFFLYRLRDVALYVTLFAVGHSATLLLGVLGGYHMNVYIVDAIIGLSVVYKGFENVGGFRRLGFEPDTRLAVLVFGLFHGFGLAAALKDFDIAPEGLVANMIAFNVGVELGQLFALTLMLVAFNLWRARPGFMKHAFTANIALMAAGFMLIGYQLTGFFVS